MKSSQPTSGRIKQKLQTRSEILKAAKALMHKKQKITLDDIAKKANISRATMYRYFSNIDILITEASLDIQHKSPDQLYDEVEAMDLKSRILHIQEHYNQLAQRNEIGFRRYLSAILSESIVSKKQLRGARRTISLNKALEPFRESLGNDTYEKLISASAVLMGIESLIVCKDVCKLDNEASDDVLAWAIEMILKGILNEKQPVG